MCPCCCAAAACLQDVRQQHNDIEAQKGGAMEDVFDAGWHRLAWLRCGGVPLARVARCKAASSCIAGRGPQLGLASWQLRAWLAHGLSRARSVVFAACRLQ